MQKYVYTDWDETQMLKKLPSDKISGTKKCLLFFFCESYFSFASLTFLTFLVFQDVFKTYLQYVFLKRLQDVFKTSCKTSSGRFQDVFRTSSKTSSRRLQDVFKKCLQDVFKTSWKTKKCYTEDAFSTSSPRRMFAGKVEKCYSREFSRLHLNGRC